MNCPVCQAENPAGTKTCICCGRELDFTGVSHYSTHGNAPTNNSGTASEWQIPRGVQGLSMAGFVPFGLYAFYNGMITWGLIGLILYILFWPLYIVYAGYITIYGRQEAWRNRRFRNLAEFESTMNAWNIGGIACCIALALMILAWTWLFSNLTMMDMSMTSGQPVGGG